MSNSKMLIDATHPEETRVVVQRNGRVEEFDFESAARKLLRGNIYLAKVTRVEPSLQAAFIDYGGNRHGFLAFNEIHPDYYQIPVADRQALLDEEAAAEAELEAAADRRAEALARRAGQQPRRNEGPVPEAESVTDAGETELDAVPSSVEPEGDDSEGSNIIDVEEDEHIEEVGGEGDDDDVPMTMPARAAGTADTISEPMLADAADDAPAAGEAGLAPSVPAFMPQESGAEDHAGGADDVRVSADDEIAGSDGDDHHDDDQHDDDHHEHEHEHEHDHDHDEAHHGAEAAGDEPLHGRADDAGGNGDMLEEVAIRPRRRPRSYKIQEVIKRRQIILVQVVKEERGNKGAALTTYLSLAGRYTVLMPNTARGGGISRKITNPQDRKRLKAIAQELEVPEGMGLIIRTAGAARTKQEIKRDFEYLLRLWESVRDLTLQSTAPSLVYEEGDLIKRSIRDLYNKDVEEVVVAGQAGYQEAAAFMHMLMPSHSKNVIEYKEPTPLFTKYGVERQLNAMFSPQVTLRSGGYIVINQTEALVAIDVNSGKSTREFSIEETALATNLEAADEIARQLKLRDLAGLIVIDFIDMEEKRNNRAVERRLKDALRHDRARIQLGRISHFGLMEMSRQRLRTGVLEGSTSQCPHCQGTGIIRSTESIALAVLRGLEDAITAGAHSALIATTTPTVALYILNSKRAYVTDMEARHGYPVTIVGSDRIQGANFTVERGAATALPRRPERAAVNMDWGFAGEEEEAPGFEGGQIETVGEIEEDLESAPRERQGREPGRDRGEGEEDGGRRKRRRRRGRGRGGRDERNEEFRNADDREDRAAGAAADRDDEDDADADVQNAAAADRDMSEGADDDGESNGSGVARGDRSDDGRGERNGRRRRRGRRGGRRGRDRDGNGAPGQSAENAGGAGDDFEPAANQPGLGPQPDLADGAVAGNDDFVSPSRTAEPRRAERIWDVRVSNDDTAPAPEAEQVTPAPAAAAPAPEPASRIAAPEPEPQAEAPNRRRHELGSSEPRIERVVVRPDQVSEAASEAAPAPQRKGWWQRKFGGE